MSPLQRLKTEFFETTRQVQYKPGLQGMTVDELGIVYLGNKAGPEYHVSNLCHELSHFIEIDDARMTQYSWGLTLPEVYVLGHRCIEPVTCQATKREIRVAAYQMNLYQHIGLKASIRSITSAFRYLPDTTWVPLEDGSAPYAEGRTHNLNGREIDASQERWIINQITALRSTYTMERFLSEWHRKIAILEARKPL